MAKYFYDEEQTSESLPSEPKISNSENLALRMTTEEVDRKSAKDSEKDNGEDGGFFKTFTSVLGVGGAIVLSLILLKELGLGYQLGKLCDLLGWEKAAMALKTSGSIFRRKQKNGVLLRGQLPDVKIRDFTWLYDALALKPYVKVDDRVVCKVADFDLVDRNFRIVLEEIPEQYLYLYDYSVSSGDIILTFCDEELDDFYEVTLPTQEDFGFEGLERR